MGSLEGLIITIVMIQTQCQHCISHELCSLMKRGTPSPCLLPLGVLCFCWHQRVGWFEVFAFPRDWL